MKTREAYYDNAKVLLIFLMVFGHLLQSYIQENKFIFALYTTIYLFHMPAFILISGYFAKGFRQKGYLLKITKKLIGPYLIFQGIYSFYYYFIHEKDEIKIDPLVPEWSLWFLVSLFCWNIMLFLFTKWKARYGLLLSVCLGVVVGYFNGINDYLSLSRTLVFFPLYLLGFYLKREHFLKIRDIKIKLISLIILLSILLAFYILPEFNYKWFFGSKPYIDFHVSGINGGIVRLGVYMLTLLTTLGFFAFVPRKNFFFTKWGTRSLYVYLLHGFFIKYFRNSGLEELLNEPGQVFVLIFLSLLIITILSSNVIKAIAQPFIELKMSALKNYVMNFTNNLKEVNN
ncbi:acyltransferase family protein [Bacillus sp. 1NLA3E]|uniref:acyltransferase family protein n=1 Tax=Bacillus sp. 1NLA3E TaxID=666686 RepID=UPI000247EDA0|nr:acyltransferase family protein [Bacillus sp. 1NLA3E]AGK54148.1 integral inner membrane protein [Bacillus sp. 1NLA3E]